MMRNSLLNQLLSGMASRYFRFIAHMPQEATDFFSFSRYLGNIFHLNSSATTQVQSEISIQSRRVHQVETTFNVCESTLILFLLCLSKQTLMSIRVEISVSCEMNRRDSPKQTNRIFHFYFVNITKSSSHNATLEDLPRSLNLSRYICVHVIRIIFSPTFHQSYSGFSHKNFCFVFAPWLLEQWTFIREHHLVIVPLLLSLYPPHRLEKLFLRWTRLVVVVVVGK
jgi:hypothetical protein